MKVVVDSAAADGLSLALRLQAEGHTVGMAIEKEDSRRCGDGLIAKVPDPVATAVEHADLVVFDMVGRGGTADLLREHGIPILGGGRFLDRLELDRIHALEVLRAAGLRMPPTAVFPDGSFERAIRFVEAHPDRWVFKPSGNLGTDKTFLAEDAEDMVEYLENIQEKLAEDVKAPPFVLQQFIPGVEISTERWYARGKPVPGLDNQTIESKKFLAGDLGPATGCAGNVVLPPDRDLFAKTVAKLDRLAAEHAVTGPLDLNAIVADQDHEPYILEATCRFGYDALQAFLRLWQMPIGETFAALADGRVPTIRLARGVSAAVRVSVPPYPSPDAKAARGTPVVDAILDDRAIWPCDVLLEDDELVIAGSDATAYVVTGTGANIAQAYGQCHRWLAKARLPDRQWRVDLIEAHEKRFAQLRRWGFFGGWRSVA